MKFENKAQVKKWLRDLALVKREMKLKIDFYTMLINDFTRLKNADIKLSEVSSKTATYLTNPSNIEFYRNEIEKCKQKHDNTLRDWNRLSELLDRDENMVVTARYLKGLSWDAMEFNVYFSRRQSFRILDRAVEKLIGQTVGVW